MILPLVSPETIREVDQEIRANPRGNLDDIDNLVSENPYLSKFIIGVSIELNSMAVAGGAQAVYEMLKRQAEKDELERMGVK